MDKEELLNKIMEILTEDIEEIVSFPILFNWNKKISDLLYKNHLQKDK